MSDVAALKQLVEKHQALQKEIGKIIIGQKKAVDHILLSIFSGGHSLLIGVPGLAKTLMVHTIASTLGLDFKRIQFTPDLLPADVIGTMIYSQKKEEFVVKKGPIFTNFVLADEINSAPAKVQSALLEAMQQALRESAAAAAAVGCAQCGAARGCGRSRPLRRPPLGLARCLRCAGQGLLAACQCAGLNHSVHSHSPGRRPSGSSPRSAWACWRAARGGHARACAACCSPSTRCG